MTLLQVHYLVVIMIERIYCISKAKLSQISFKSAASGSSSCAHVKFR